MMTNRVTNLEKFIQLWDRNVILPETDLDILKKSPQGNINIDGTASCFMARLLISSHPKFEEAIESGVRKLVMALIKKFNCITYSSCQGHFFSDKSAPMRERVVQIIPRDNLEHEYLLNVLKSLANSANLKVRQKSVKLLVYEENLASKNLTMSGIRMQFKSQVEDEEIYFREIEGLYTNIVDLISSYVIE